MRFLVIINFLLAISIQKGYCTYSKFQFDSTWKCSKIAIISQAKTLPNIEYKMLQNKMIFNSSGLIIDFYSRQIDDSTISKYHFDLLKGNARLYQNSNFIEDYKLIDIKRINLFNEWYEIYKYVNINPPVDGEGFLYFCPTFGIIFIKSTAWYNYSRLVSIAELGNENIINQIVELIFYDNTFFNSYYSQEYNDSLISAPYKEIERKKQFELDSLKKKDEENLKGKLIK